MAPDGSAVTPNTWAAQSEPGEDNGKVRGFEIIKSTPLAADENTDFVGEAFALVIRAPRRHVRRNRHGKGALRGWWGIEFVSLKTRGPVALLG